MLAKILFIVFAKKVCRRNHAIRYALDLHKKGHTARIILEGPATWSLKELSDPHTEFTKLFTEALESGLVVGVCRAASSRRCSGNDCSDVTSIAAQKGIPLLDDACGHAGIEPFVRDGFQIVVF